MGNSSGLMYYIFSTSAIIDSIYSFLYQSSKIKLQSLTWVILSNIFFHEVHLTVQPFTTVTINICQSMEKEPVH